MTRAPAPRGAPLAAVLALLACAGGAAAVHAAPPPGDAALPPRFDPAPPPLPARDPATVRVALRAAGPRRTVSVSVRGPGRIEAEGGKRILRAGEGFTSRVEGLEGGRLRVDGEEAGRGPVLLLPAGGQGFLLEQAAYAGDLEVAAGQDGSLLLANRVPFPLYLEGVLAGELFPDAPPEALRALAVLARSFALLHLGDLTDDPGLHQAYRGRAPAATAAVLSAAVRGTEGLRLVDGKGRPLCNYWYHSTCGGHTADASDVFGAPAVPAYAGVPCTKCGSSKYWTWECEVPEEDLRRAVRFGSPVASVSVGSRSLDGRVLTFRATAAGGTVRYVPALQVRQALGPNRLRSTLLTSIEAVRRAGGKADLPGAFVLRGKGWGHGVGLCQIGACNLAKEGWTAERILALYYPGARVVRAAR